jgi:hypothetical protein
VPRCATDTCLQARTCGSACRSRRCAPWLWVFRRALKVVAFFREEKIAVKVQNLENTFRWSEAEPGIAVSKAPDVLTMPKDMLQR